MDRARIEEEREKRDRDLKEMEMKSRMASLSAQQSVPAFEAQMAEYQRRYGHQMPPHFGLFPPAGRERLGLQMPAGGPESVHSQQMQEQIQNERLAALNDPLGMYVLAEDWSLTRDYHSAVRLQMANLASELHNHAHTHAHTHAHAHTHLHLHPHDAMAGGSAPPGLDSAAPSIHTPHPLSLPPAPPGMRPPGLMPRTGADLMHPAGLFRPQMLDDQLAHQVSNLCPSTHSLLVRRSRSSSSMSTCSAC